MANTLPVLGVKEFQDNLKKEKALLAKRVQQALSTAGLFLQRESQQRVPVDYGILKASAFTRANGRGLNTVVNVGYTALYAMYVHENIEMKGRGMPRDPGNPGRGNFWDPAGRGQAKFLEEPARTLRPQLLKIVQNAVKLPIK